MQVVGALQEQASPRALAIKPVRIASGLNGLEGNEKGMRLRKGLAALVDCMLGCSARQSNAIDSLADPRDRL
jgi:hypothetical protein